MILLLIILLLQIQKEHFEVWSKSCYHQDIVDICVLRLLGVRSLPPNLEVFLYMDAIMLHLMDPQATNISMLQCDSRKRNIQQQRTEWSKIDKNSSSKEFFVQIMQLVFSNTLPVEMDKGLPKINGDGLLGALPTRKRKMAHC